MSRLDAHHIRVLVIPEIRHLLRPVCPRVPHDRVGEVVLLDAHLPAGHHVCYDVLLRGVLVYPVRPFVDGDDVTALLVDSAIAGLVNESAAVEAGDLTPSHIRHFKIGVEEQVEAESQIFARIVGCYVEMQLLFA